MKRNSPKSASSLPKPPKRSKHKVVRKKPAKEEVPRGKLDQTSATSEKTKSASLGLNWDTPALAAKQFIEAGGDIQSLICGFRELVMKWAYDHDDGIGDRAFQEIRRCFELGEINLQELYKESCCWTDKNIHAELKRKGFKFSEEKLARHGGKVANWAADVLARHYRRVKAEIEGSNEATRHKQSRVPAPEKSIKHNFIRDCMTARVTPREDPNAFKKIYAPSGKPPSGRFYNFALHVLTSDGWDNVEAYDKNKVNPIRPSHFRTLTPEEFEYHWNRNGKTALELKKDLFHKHASQLKGKIPHKSLHEYVTNDSRQKWNDLINRGWPPRELPLILVCERELPLLWKWCQAFELNQDQLPKPNQAANKIKPHLKRMLCERFVVD